MTETKRLAIGMMALFGILLVISLLIGLFNFYPTIAAIIVLIFVFLLCSWALGWAITTY